MKNKFYFLHIPKTGGHYLIDQLITPLKKRLKPKGIKFIGSYHLAWYIFDHYNIDETYIISVFRDPAKRTVSHFCFSMFKNADSSPRKGAYELNVEGLFKWVEDFQNYLTNFQVKNFIAEYNSKDAHIDTLYYFIQEISFTKIKTIDRELLQKRLDRIDILLKDTQLNKNTMESVAQKIFNDFKISEPLWKFRSDFIPNSHYSININAELYNMNKDSELLFSQLNEQQIQKLYDLSPIDTEVYFNNSLFWNEGK